MEKIYLVKYRGGDFDSSYNVTIFATFDENKAVKYIEKFNHILKKWKQYYSQFEEYGWIKE